MIKIITDSGSDIPQNEAEKLGIRVIPIVTIFGKEEFLDGVTITHEEFYHRMEDLHEYPKTTQVNPTAYQKAFEEELEKGNDVICITLGSKLSGCYQSALIAKDMIGSDKVHNCIYHCSTFLSVFTHTYSILSVYLSRYGVFCDYTP